MKTSHVWMHGRPSRPPHASKQVPTSSKFAEVQQHVPQSFLAKGHETGSVEPVPGKLRPTAIQGNAEIHKWKHAEFSLPTSKAEAKSGLREVATSDGHPFSYLAASALRA